MENSFQMDVRDMRVSPHRLHCVGNEISLLGYFTAAALHAARSTSLPVGRWAGGPAGPALSVSLCNVGAASMEARHI